MEYSEDKKYVGGDNMLNVTKKAVSVLLIFFLCFSLSFCAYEQRVDFSECVRRMNKLCKAYEINVGEAFFSEGEWFCFVDALGDDDVLITGTEGDGRLLSRVTVSVINNSAEGQSRVFGDFCEAAVRAFTQNADTQRILEDSHARDESAVFTDCAFFSENGRYKTSFYSAGMGSTFVIEIIK